jgi:hypothetical protein
VRDGSSGAGEVREHSLHSTAHGISTTQLQHNTVSAQHSFSATQLQRNTVLLQHRFSTAQLQHNKAQHSVSAAQQHSSTTQP